MSNIIDAVKRAVGGDSTGKTNDSTATDSSYGPGGASAQRSNFATTGDHDTLGDHDRGIPKQTDVAGGAKHNQQGGSLLSKMTDPRGEFDRDNQVGSGAGSRHTGAGAGFGSNTHGSTNAGPHDSNVANKVDPRVDSDRDGRATHDTTHGSTNAGPHNSNMMNKLDPRVDSDRDGRTTTHDSHHSATDHRGASHHKSSTAGGFGMGSTDHATSTAHPDNHHTSNASGPHNSNVLNKLDPRVDSDRDNRANPASHTGGLGNTQHDSHVTRGNNFGTGDNTGSARTFGTTTHNTTHLGGNTSTNAGPHDSNVANKLDPRVDSDRDGRATHHDTTGLGGNTHGSSTHGGPGSAAFAPSAHGSQSTGPGSALGPNTHGSNIANKLDPRVDAAGNHHNTSKMGPQVVGGAHNTHDNQHTAGPHNSDALNKADPRVDSDRDGRAHHGTTSMGAMGSNTHHNTSDNHGPHNSNVLNKVDPRVDSDRDGRAHHNTIGSTTHGTTHMGPTAGTHGSTNTGPHNSNVANKLDPRVDSDRDGRSNPTSHTGTGHHTNQHVSSMVDGPTVGSAAPPKDLGAHNTHGNTTTGTHTGSTGTTHHGPGGLNKTSGAAHNLPGPAPNTAGPHKSDLLNKLDPRVDSNQDGSKTIGSAPKY